MEKHGKKDKEIHEGWPSFWDVKIVCECSGSPIPLQGAKAHPGQLSRDSQHGWASKHTLMLSAGDKKWQLGHLRAVWAGHGPIFCAGCQVLYWEAEWGFLSCPPNTAFVWDISGGKKRLWGWPHQPATGALPQEMVISSPVEHSPLTNCYLNVSLTSPFPPVESCLCRPPCLNLFLVRLLVLECSWRVMHLPEFLHGKLQHVPFKQFSQECWEAESVLLAAQERRNPTNTNLF